MVLGSQIYSVCNVKPNFTQPGPVDVLWDLLYREQVSGLCPLCCNNQAMSLDHRPLGRQEFSDLQTEVQKWGVNCQRTHIKALAVILLCT